jgi:hypothetical protein
MSALVASGIRAALPGWRSPLELIALDDDGAGDFPIAPPLKLGSDVDEKRAALGGRKGICGLQPHECGASRSQVLIQRARFHFMLNRWILNSPDGYSCCQHLS